MERKVHVWVRDGDGVWTARWNGGRKRVMNNDEWQCGGQRNKCSHSVRLHTLLPPSLSLKSSSASLYQTLLLTAVLHHGLLNLIIGLLPASFTPLLSLLKTLMTLLLLCCCCSVHTSRGSPTHSNILDRCFTSTLCCKLCLCVWGVYECIIKQWVG